MSRPSTLTPAGAARLRQALNREYDRIENARRLVREQREANEQESLGLVEAQQHLIAVEMRIAELEEILAQAVIFTDQQDDRVTLGCTVVLRDVDTGHEIHVQLVSPAEVNLPGGAVTRLSSLSPVGAALLDRRAGEAFTVTTGRREVTYMVQQVTFEG
ncbi:GreA/GreB family elongation factor [Deinococcus peraridilitoris]|uniref:Transcription elongation factor n=1 Tax=Deinococcus peraridilitoris (strain DSM 19664 / LMG 22246 / CIP 109416 / KR-200) TaxID=937777 RepID=L0A0I2_DEIPD|nr:GreA/GreB family elongation factor [Deinococcus peraridilitoris]AFZ67403.1 transcription elongation factor [Deinococcus peraridilitoris DSM 19664]